MMKYCIEQKWKKAQQCSTRMTIAIIFFSLETAPGAGEQHP